MNNPDLILPSSYLPSISYYYEIVHKDSAIVDVHEHFINRTFRNRCEIYGANGSLNLSIPVQRINGKCKMKDVKISYEMDWQLNHWRSIETSYKSSPFFEYYKHRFLEAFKHQTKYLIDLNDQLFKITLKILDIDTKLININSYVEKEDNQLDYRELFNKRNKINFSNKP